MIKIFVSYARDDATTVSELVKVIHELGYDPWMDRELRGGQVWWEQILDQIRHCDLFIFGLSPSSSDSTACTRELLYADALGKTILPVRIEPVASVATLPPQLASRQILDFQPLEVSTATRLARVLHEARPSGNLPDPLPAPPDVPLSYLGKVGLAIGREDLSYAEQSQILFDLKAGMADDPASRGDALALLNNFRRRPDLFARIDREIEALVEPVDPGSNKERATRQAVQERASIVQEGGQVGRSRPSASPASPHRMRLRPQIVMGVLLAGLNFLISAMLDAVSCVNIKVFCDSSSQYVLLFSLLAGAGGFFGAASIPRLTLSAFWVGVGGLIAGLLLARLLSEPYSLLILAPQDNYIHYLFFVFATQSLVIYGFLMTWGRGRRPKGSPSR